MPTAILPGLRAALACFAATALAARGLVAAEMPDEPPPFEEVCFADFHIERDGCPSRQRITSLFEPVGGHRGDISEQSFYGRPVQHLAGLFRLKPRWKSDTVLRLLLASPKRFGIHFWNGSRGILLRYHSDPNRGWSAYGTTRKGKGPLPETAALWALDNGRYYRSGRRTIEIRHHQDQVIVSHGDLVLLRAPLEGTPKEVYIEGEADIRGIALARSGPPPVERIDRPVVWQCDRPADLEWHEIGNPNADGPTFRSDDGTVRLSATAETTSGGAFVDLGRPGFHEFIFELVDPQPGTGVFLGDDAGRPIAKVAFFRADTLKVTTYHSIDLDGNAWGKQYNLDYHIVPRAGRRQWLRLVAGGGCFRYATSGDGVHFTEPASSGRTVRGACCTAGLFCTVTSKTTDRTLALRSLRIRRLQRLSSLTPEGLLRRVGPLEVAADFDDWEARVAESRPWDVPPPTWRRACSVYSLVHNAAGGDRILDDLLTSLLAEDRPLEWKLGLLDEAALVADFREYGKHLDVGRRFEALYVTLGRQLARQGHPAPFSVVSHAMLRSPGWNIRLNAFPQELLRHELIGLAQNEDWQRVAEVCRRIRYFTWLDELGRDLKPQRTDDARSRQLVAWATAQATLHGGRGTARPDEADVNGFRHPLEEQTGKAGFNVYQEFRAALAADAPHAACRALGAARGTARDELLPSPDDSRLLVALSVAVRQSIEQHPALRAAMQQHFGPRAALRMQKAGADGDVSAVHDIGVQFTGTAAAAEAHQWLGDRLLSQGHAGKALGEYHWAIASAPDEQRTSLAARQRLAAAMLGRDQGEPAQTTVQIGTLPLSPQRFEQLVGQARGAHAVGSGGDTSGIASGPPPGHYHPKTLTTLDTAGEKSPDGMPQDLCQQGIDLGARRIAVRAIDKLLLLATGQQQVLFDLEAAKNVWAERFAPEQCSAWWSLGPLPVTVCGKSVFHCRLEEEASRLVCRSLEDGKPTWDSPDGAAAVVSDVLPVGADLVALALTQDLGWHRTLHLARFDPTTGRQQAAREIVRLRDYWSGAVPCRAVLANHLVVATVAGSVLCCDLEGRVQWIRRQVMVPPPESLSKAEDWLRQAHRRPLVADGRVYATQPGVWAVECMDLEAGTLYWRTPLPRLVCLAGRLGSRLIVETDDGLAALDVADGEVLWRHTVDEKSDMRVCGGPEALCYAALETADDPQQPRRPMLVWVDPEDGGTLAETVLDTSDTLPDTRHPLPGPMLTVAGQTWLFMATAENPNSRAICVLAHE